MSKHSNGGDSLVIQITQAENQSGVLITGGRGFMGRSLAKLLRRHSYRVISADVTPVRDEANESLCDIANLSQLRDLFQRTRPAAIVHLAAILPTAAQRDPASATQVNVQGSLNLLTMAREFGVRRFIFGSSLSVYGSWGADQIVSELDRAAPEDLYGAAKLYGEQLGDIHRKLYGMEFVSLRIGRVVGPGARSTTSAWRSDIFESIRGGNAREIEIPYAASERILLVHVEDVVRMLLELLRAPRLQHSLYNAGCESVMVGELKSAVERLNSRVRINLGGQPVVGNPRRVDWRRFAGEFGFALDPISEQLAEAAVS